MLLREVTRSAAMLLAVIWLASFVWLLFGSLLSYGYCLARFFRVAIIWLASFVWLLFGSLLSYGYYLARFFRMAIIPKCVYIPACN
jgi:hypothetical protein